MGSRYTVWSLSDKETQEDGLDFVAFDAESAAEKWAEKIDALADYGNTEEVAVFDHVTQETKRFLVRASPSIIYTADEIEEVE